MLMLSALLATGCSDEVTPATPAPANTWFPLRVGDQTVQVQLAITTAEMRRGLMHRESLAPDHGMIFLYPRPQRLSFYMRNTSIPLDIGYFTLTGELREIYPMFPFDETSVASRSTNIQFALEMNQGWFAEHGVRPGAMLHFEDLREAVRTRGFDPGVYGL